MKIILNLIFGMRKYNYWTKNFLYQNLRHHHYVKKTVQSCVPAHILHSENFTLGEHQDL